MELSSHTVFGFLKPSVDVHTLGISIVSSFLQDCGYKTVIADDIINKAIENLFDINNISILRQWILQNHITNLGFSYRLEPKDGARLFCKFYYTLSNLKLFSEQGGCVEDVFFAGLPITCNLVKIELGSHILTFSGGEEPAKTLSLLGVPNNRIPKTIECNNDYDNFRKDFAKRVIESESYKKITPQDHYGYAECGTDQDSFLRRVEYCKRRKSLPIIRAHAGPYNINPFEAIREFYSWTKTLAQSRLLDVLSIGTSQLTQSHFGENWDGLSNGGGVPINSEMEYETIYQLAKPMLVRTYAGTKNICSLAKMYERVIHISWHALSLWWFCKIDGRGENTLLENLREHFETIKYIASSGTPLEPNVPHHFAFRGCDDVSYIVSGFLACKAAKLMGCSHVILQNMLNTPKYTWGIEDLAKGRVMLRLIKRLEDSAFKVYLQTRAGLDYFLPDMEKAKVQLSAVTALMDDIDPQNSLSPDIIHVVSYSEALQLATPEIITDSIKITLETLKRYRALKHSNNAYDINGDSNLKERESELFEEAASAIEKLEKNIPLLYTPEGFYKVFVNGFFPLPYLFDSNNEYPYVTNWRTVYRNGGIVVIDQNRNKIPTSKRYEHIIERINQVQRNSSLV